MRAPSFANLLSLLALAFLGCSGGSPCTPGMSVACACVGGATGAQVCASDGTYGLCQCPGSDAGAPRDSGTADGSADRDAAVASCDEAGELALGPGIPTIMGGSIAAVADIEGDERLEIVAFTSSSPTEVRVGTWSATALDGPSRQLIDLSGFQTQQVALDDSALPTLIGVLDPSGARQRIAYRFGPSGYESVDVRVLPELSSSLWYGVSNGVIDIYGHSFSRVFASPSAWAFAGSLSDAPLYRLTFDSDRVSAEQADRAAIFGSDATGLLGIDGDLNEDGIEDFILLTSSDFWITESAPGGAWTRIASISRASCAPSLGAGFRFALVADLDRDGDRDIVFNRNCTAQRRGYLVALRVETGYELVHHSLPDESGEPVAVGDLDGDCYPDLLFSDGSVAVNDGDGRFPDPVHASEAVGGVATVVDLDFDGDNDIVWAASFLGPGGPIVQLNLLR